MKDTDFFRRLRATGVFAGIGSGMVMAVILAVATDAWWLLGLGGAGGFVLNGLARGAFLRSGDEPEKITPGTSSLLEGDS